jgi:tetratricopeptide (TPR) repeat protein
LSHQGRFEESYEQFAQALKLYPQYAEAHYNWGLVLANRGDTQGATEHFHAALTADANYVPAHQRLGEDARRQGQYAEAQSHYEAVARLKPDDPAAQINLGLLYLKQQQPVKAAEVLARTVAQHPEHALARQALAQARRQAEQAPVTNPQ